MMIAKIGFMFATLAEIAGTFFSAFHNAYILNVTTIRNVDIHPIADMAISLVVQYALAYCLTKFLKWDKYKSLIIGDIVSNILLLILLRS